MNTSRASRWFAFGLMALLLLLLVPVLGRAQETGGPFLYLQAVQFDPLEGEQVTAQELQATPGPGVQSYLLQFTGPVLPDWKQAVEAYGVQLYGYVPDYAFVARMDAQTADRVSGLGFVRWIGLYHPAYRLAPELLSAGGEAAAAAAGEPLILNVEVLPDADLASLEAQLQDLGGEVLSRSLNGFAGYLRLSLPADRLAEAAGLDGVVWVEPFFQPEILNNVGGTGIMRAGEARSTLGLSGKGQVVTVADTGLDRGAAGTHPDVQGRIVKSYCLGRPAPCDWSDFGGHGTHVVGSVLGSGAGSGGLYAGTAPQAGLIIQSLDDAFGSLSGIPIDVGDLMRTARADGSFIHSNSWGGTTGYTNLYGGYDTESSQVDTAAWENKDMLVLFAAGNSGADVNKDGLVDSDSLASPGTAKNALTVGASENNRPAINNTWGLSYGSPIAGDLRANNAAGMAAFSSRGPADDGRIKPDVVAPGTFIASLRSQNFVFNDPLETADTPGRYTIVGGSGNWAWATGDAHSPTHYWKAAPGDDILLTQTVNLYPVGSAFQFSFFHKYILGGDDKLKVWFTDGDLSPALTLTLGSAGTQSAYDFESLTIGTQDLLSGGLDVSQLRVGFSIDDGADNVINGSTQWWLDDIRIEGASWGTLGSYGLTTPGSAVDNLYVMQGGTSMATPLTAGAAALTREWLTTRYTSPLYPNHVAAPSAALLKALLINGAVDLSPGQYASPQEIPAARPNSVTGWGRVDLMASLAPGLPEQVWLKDNNAGLATGETATYNLAIAQPPAAALSAPGPRADLSWDFAGSAQAAPVPDKPTPEPRPVSGGEPLRVTLISDPQAASAQATTDEISQIFLNTGFETDGAWVATGMARTTDQAYSGSWSMGSLPGQDGEFYQQVVIPADAITATQRYVFKNLDPDLYASGCYDGHTVEVWNEDFSTRLAYIADPALFCVNDTAWHGLILDFSESIMANLRGKTINFKFLVDQDDVPPHSTVYFDEAVLEVSTPGVVTPLPTTPPPPITSGDPLRVTLVWTDYPGAANAAKALVNNLDLEVIAPDGTHYWGNAGAYAAGSPCLVGGKDVCNNVEGVIIPEADFGGYQIIVHGVNVPQGGKQPFAVVASGTCLLGNCALSDGLFLPLLLR